MNGRGALDPSKTDDTFAPRILIRIVDRAFWLASCSPDDDGTTDLSERTRSDPRRIRIIYLYFLFNKLANCVNDSKSMQLCARGEKDKKKNGDAGIRTPDISQRLRGVRMRSERSTTELHPHRIL